MKHSDYFYIYLSIFGLLINISNAYNQTDTSKTLKYFALGVEIVGPIEKFITADKGNYEINIQPQISKNLFFVSEIGQLDFSKQIIETNKSYQYTLSGNYIRMGIDFNVFRRNKTNEPNFILIGCRMGFSTTKHEGDNIMISDIVWGDKNFNFPTSKTKSNWFEVTSGIRSQIVSFLALEWQFRLKYLINKQTPDYILPYYIAGFGKSNQKFAIGFTYHLYFTFKY